MQDADDPNRLRLGVFTWPPGTALARRPDASVVADSWAASPRERAEKWCREAGVPLALVTDDDTWMVVWAPRGGPSASCWWRLADRWPDPARTEAARSVLEAEGIEFDGTGRANPAQRLAAEELALIAGLDTEEELEPGDEDDAPLDGRAARFLAQVTDFQSPETLDGLRVVLNAWTDIGGELDYGASEETSCFLMPAIGVRPPWPFTIYPSGKVEVVFQHMASRPPFDDVEMREELRRRLDAIEGIDLPASKIGLRPGFPLEVLRYEVRRDAIIEALAWFLATLQAADTTTLATS